jgi:hypothetical protein
MNFKKKNIENEDIKISPEILTHELRLEVERHINEITQDSIRTGLEPKDIEMFM